MGDQSPLHQVIEVVLLIAERIQSPWVQPAGRPDLDEDPPRLVRLPFAFFARSIAAVLSSPMVADRARAEGRRRGESESGGEIERKRRENGGVRSRGLARDLL